MTDAAPRTRVSLAPGTSLLLLLCVPLCLSYSLVQAVSGVDLDGNTLIRYLPTATLTALAGLALLTARSTAITLHPTVLCLVLATSIAFTGSVLTALLGAAFAETFLGRTIAMTAVFAGLLVGADPGQDRRVERWVVGAGCAFALAGAAVRIAHGYGLIRADLPQILHEEQFLIAAGITHLALGTKSSTRRFLLLAMLLLVAHASGKAMSWLLALASFAIVVALPWIGRLGQEPGQRWVRLALWSSIGLVVALSTVLIYAEWAASRPQDWRTLIFAQRLEEFFTSPIIGRVYWGSPLIVGLPGDDGMQVPGHSDLLDVLAFGGLLSFALIAAAFVHTLAGKEAREAYLPSSQGSRTAYIYHALGFFLVTASVNPILATPRIASVVWFLLGLGLARRILPRDPPHPEVARRIADMDGVRLKA